MHRGLPTLREALRAAASAGVAAEITPKELARWAHRQWRKVLELPVPAWHELPEYVAAFANVIAACASAGVSPKHHVQAQLDTVGIAVKLKGRRKLQPGTFHGANADARYQKWAEGRNISRTGRLRDERTVQLRERLLTAAAVFGVAYIADDHSWQAAQVSAQSASPGWRLADADHEQQLAALVAGAEALLPGLADKVLLREDWDWPRMKGFLRTVTDTGSADDVQPVEDDEDGLGSWS